MSIGLKQSKPHYEILDGLRGVAAIMVVWFHIFEIHSEWSYYKQIINHGYLAVDFFFLLSGFVIGYAYDDRWGKMTLFDFFKRRIIRLQPMIIAGSIIGGIAYFFQDSPDFKWIVSDTSVWKVLLLTVIGATLLPVGKSMDVRGWGEMHPLNGPAWSLFFEYIANIFYALILRRLSNLFLSLLVLIAAGATVHYLLTTPNGCIIGGWSISDWGQIKLGMIRLSYPFLVGLLMSRLVKLKHVKYSFLICSLLLAALLSVPRLGWEGQEWINGIYEIICILFMFPFIVWLGAGGQVEGGVMKSICKFLGNLSYPLYIIHYPIVYIYMAYVQNNNYKLADSWPVAIALFVAVVIVAYTLMRLYDIPLRKWLRNKYL